MLRKKVPASRLSQLKSIRSRSQDGIVRAQGVDIGGSLTKCVDIVVKPVGETLNKDIDDVGEASEEIALTFVSLELYTVENGDFSFINSPLSTVTGGGSFKYSDALDKLDISVQILDEIESQVQGLRFMNEFFPTEEFSVGRSNNIASNEEAFELSFPLLLVSIGTGMSILRIDSWESFRRVGGSSIAGGTFHGLSTLIAGTSSFEKIIAMCREGDNTVHDKLVGDIYGEDYLGGNLPKSLIAGSFANVAAIASRKERDQESSKSKKDLLSSLYFMVCYNIGHVVSLLSAGSGSPAKQAVVIGNFTENEYTREGISDAIEFWSKGSLVPVFPKHGTFIGSIGAAINLFL